MIIDPGVDRCPTCQQPIPLVVLPQRRGGRPIGHGTYSAAELRQFVLLTAERLWRDGTVPTLVLVGYRIGYSADGLSRALRRHDLTWPTIRSDARRRSFGRFWSGEAA